MSIPISQLPADLVYNGQLDVSNGVKQAKYNQLNDAWNNANNGGSNSSGSGFQPISAPDFNKLEQQSFDLLKPYYLQLAKEAQGDFKRATSILEEDYTTGTRQATEDYLRKTSQTGEDLQANLKSLGLTFGNENEQKVDELNKRGMAVYEQSPDGSNNVVTPGQLTPSPNTGRGGVELGNLAKDQQLRQQAVQRTADRAITEAGITKGRYTNTAGVNTAGMSPEQAAKALAGPGVDRTQLGSSELALVRGQENNTRNYQTTTENLANQFTQQGLNMANSVAGAQQKEIPEALKNQYNIGALTQFQNTGA